MKSKREARDVGREMGEAINELDEDLKQEFLVACVKKLDNQSRSVLARAMKALN